MNKLVLLFLIVAATICFVEADVLVREVFDIDKADHIFEEYIKNFSKEYKDEKEKQARFEIFKKTLIKINEINKVRYHYTLGLNQFADRKPEELKDILGVRTVVL